MKNLLQNYVKNSNYTKMYVHRIRRKKKEPEFFFRRKVSQNQKNLYFCIEIAVSEIAVSEVNL